MRILFLDDDEQRHDTAQKYLKTHDADFVRTAPQAIEKLSSHRYDVAFLDHDLGGEHYVSSGREDTRSRSCSRPGCYASALVA